jgi:hypothetical protein
MASVDQIAANRRNARRSTGPRTAAGKRKVSENALRHGLLASLHTDAAMGDGAARIAAALAGPNASPYLRALVTPIAEAQADILRIRSARAALINQAAASLPADDEGEAAPIAQSLPKLVLLDRYERSAMRRRHRAMRELRKSFTMCENKIA